MSPSPAQAARVLRLGLLTDLHYGPAVTCGSRYCPDSLRKLDVALACFQEARVDAVFLLGDLTDTPSVREEREHLGAIVAHLKASGLPCHFVLGNHCLASLTRQDFYTSTGSAEHPHTVDMPGLRVIVMDACYRADGQPYTPGNFSWKDSGIPGDQCRWLADALAASTSPCLVVLHHRLDAPPPYGPANAPAIRAILEASGKVVAVLQGHDHHGALSRIAGIPYLTLRAMVEGPFPEANAFAVLEYAPPRLSVIGHGVQPSVPLQT